MKVVVLGAGGQLGDVVARVAAASGHDVLAWTRADADITAPADLTTRLKAARPQAIFNCAAWSSVDDAEDAPEAVLAINAMAPRTLARAANTLGATLVHYSTDFVFDGTTPGPNTEDRPPNPRGVYATSKLIGEWMAADARVHFVLRVESLFGGRAAKSSVDQIRRRLEEGAEVRAFADRTVTASYVQDVAHASISLVTQHAAPGVYHCVNSGVTNWFELAHEIARLAGMASPNIVPVSMAAMTMRVQRPLNAALSNDKLCAAGVRMPTWQDALARYIAAPSQA